MAVERGGACDALTPCPPGPLLQLSCPGLDVAVAASAGGRLASVRHRGMEWLQGPAHDDTMIGWGCYPMVPWAGRLGNARFVFEGREHVLAANLRPHAIHGLGFSLPWRVDRADTRTIELSLALPRDRRWPFGGVARQRIRVEPDALRLALSLQADRDAMPFVLGWHPWFARPDRLGFTPMAMYGKGADGIARLPPGAPDDGPWDDCFVNRAPVRLQRGERTLVLRSDCDHWVLYDERPDATCVEPQTGPPDAFNLGPEALAPGQRREAWFHWEWH